MGKCVVLLVLLVLPGRLAVLGCGCLIVEALVHLQSSFVDVRGTHSISTECVVQRGANNVHDEGRSAEPIVLCLSLESNNCLTASRHMRIHPT